MGGVCLMCKPLTQQCARSSSWAIPMAAQHQQRAHDSCLSSGTTYSAMYKILSLVPRPSDRPAIDCLQYTKTGKAWEHLSMHDINVYLDRQKREGPSNTFCACFLCPVQQAATILCCECSELQTHDQGCKKKPQTLPFVRGLLPPLGRH